MSKTSSGNDSESTGLGWKFVIIVAVITTIFFTFLYLAMSSEPDYMPSQQQNQATSHNSTDRQHHQNDALNPSQHSDQPVQHQPNQ